MTTVTEPEGKKKPNWKEVGRWLEPALKAIGIPSMSFVLIHEDDHDSIWPEDGKGNKLPLIVSWENDTHDESNGWYWLERVLRPPGKNEQPLETEFEPVLDFALGAERALAEMFAEKLAEIRIREEIDESIIAEESAKPQEG